MVKERIYAFFLKAGKQGCKQVLLNPKRALGFTSISYCCLPSHFSHFSQSSHFSHAQSLR